MMAGSKLLYSPALRMKAGELDGVRLLASDVADCVLPRFIVPPSGERDDENMPLLLSLDRVPDISRLMCGAWQKRAALIDLSYIIEEFGRENTATWLPPLFQRARGRSISAIPAATLDDITDCGPAFRAAIDRQSSIKFAVVVPFSMMIGPEFAISVTSSLEALEVAASDCVVIADFADADFSEPSAVAPVIAGALETLQEQGLWQRIIFQGSHYPDKNPAPERGGVESWPRNEWAAWRAAVKFDPTTAEHMVFGDYAADCSRIAFGDGGGKAIRHIRYTVGEHWHVHRAPKTGSDLEGMHKVYCDIVGSGRFAGPGFSEADAYIARAAGSRTASHGNAKTWRQLNTTHHITQVVRDVAKVRGVLVKRQPEAIETQPFLLNQAH